MNKSILLIVMVVLGMVATGIIGSGRSVGAVAEQSHVPGRILVQFENGVPANQKALLVANERAQLGEQIGKRNVFIAHVPVGTEKATAAALRAKKGVVRTGVDGIATALGRPVQPVVVTPDYFDRQYALKNTGQSFTNTTGTITIANGLIDADIDAPEAWSVTRGQGVKVAVLDTGVDKNHEDISGKVVARANFSGARSDDDLYGHGTHVAGIIAAYQNGKGVTGVCPDCTVMSGKVLNDNGSGSESSVLRGVEWATANGAAVINMSLGFTAETPFLKDSIDDAIAANVTVVAAAGNLQSATDTTGPIYPAYYDNVIAVGATDNTDTKASFSNYGGWVDVAAPGASVYSTFPNHKFTLQRTAGRALSYDIANGTSMASPVVAGVVALTIAAHPGASSMDVRAMVELTTENTGQNGGGAYWVYGRVNAFNAVNK